MNEHVHLGISTCPNDTFLFHGLLTGASDAHGLTFDIELLDVQELNERLMRGDFSDLSWKKIGSALRISYLKTGDPQHEFALYHIRAGGRIPNHTHHGSEMTLVLQGGFSDANGSYHEGDFLFRGPEDDHAPTALQSEDCICLVVLDAPLKFTDWRFRWMNPFLKLRAV